MQSFEIYIFEIATDAQTTYRRRQNITGNDQVTLTIAKNIAGGDQVTVTVMKSFNKFTFMRSQLMLERQIVNIKTTPATNW